VIKITNITTNEEQTFSNNKGAAEIIAELKITDNSIQTIATKFGKALKNGELLYNVLRVESIKEADSFEDIENETKEDTSNVLEEKIENEINETTNINNDKNKELEDSKKENKRIKGIAIEWYENDELKQTFPSI
jgi:hypothetical protein